ncbi:hypothetical protein K1719_005900 [Acacia pycnantha]|nr:hypothetical protein K1719_005900 [Acacia pycnantha]
MQAVADVAASIRADSMTLAESHRKAAAATASGKFKDEMIPVSTKVIGRGCLRMKRSVAMQKGLPILGIFKTFAAVGVNPAIMGVDPAAVKAAWS